MLLIQVIMVSYRFMRVIVMFDLPTLTAENRRDYRRFRSELLKNGFIMMQESVYTRLLLTPSAKASVCNIIRKAKPPEGFVQVLTVTEKQFSHIEHIAGEYKSEMLDTDERLVIL